MNRILITCCLMLITAIASSQQDTVQTVEGRSAVYYQRTARAQKIAGIVAITAGFTGFMCTAMVSSLDFGISLGGNAVSGNNESAGQYGGYYAASAASLGLGLILLQQAKTNRLRGRQVAINMGIQKAAVFGSADNGTIAQPALRIQVPLHGKAAR